MKELFIFSGLTEEQSNDLWQHLSRHYGEYPKPEDLRQWIEMLRSTSDE